MNAIIETILSAAFVAAVIRTTTPVLFASLGGLLSDLVGSLNVALEGMMLIGALTSVIVSAYAPWYVGVLAGIAVGGMLGALMALFHLRFKADVILVGFAVNIVAAGGTVTVLNYATGGDKGTSINLPSKAIPALDLSFLNAIPGIGPVLTQMFSGHSYLTWLAAFLVFAIWYFLYRTPEGLRFRAVGEYPAAAEAAGISPNRLRTYGLIASGALAGLGGAQLAMFNFVGFTRDMTAGRGFIALGAVLLGRRHPVGTAIAAVLFGAFEALSIALPGILPQVPGEVIHSIPFVVTVLALMLSSRRRIAA
ncbi:ABC transporter permease [Mesorhizobium sp. BR1-1-16]|uniref:ABC transporter permease n=1 Tax=Mesorhizobium sp. BR1-1-16 TaxID=2876653 RepID=UPI001CCB821E|nr:ABC transporter permease [Mesorhizobium sp. BR1-1-16]MBZ9936205.1 ABC transporter permease [Mesorhizobium sp. BR1-1-16]